MAATDGKVSKPWQPRIGEKTQDHNIETKVSMSVSLNSLIQDVYLDVWMNYEHK